VLKGALGHVSAPNGAQDMKIDNLQILRERGLADPLLSQAEC
jgi:hypothetical protein